MNPTQQQETRQPAASGTKKPLKVKVCGMKYRDNIADLLQLQPDLIGLIFYPKSPRFVEPEREELDLAALPPTVQKVGVFVNEPIEMMLQKARHYQLAALQLHGEEPPEVCAALQAEGYTVLKAFAVHEAFDFDQLEAYQQVCGYFLFDTKGKNYGGNGVAFDWSILNKYRLPVPFLLSGGIGPEHAEAVRQLMHPMLAGIDLNSRFETSPGRKDVEKLREMIYLIKQERQE
jgi:phosphoribosylanthranilate isomerase